MPDPVRTDDSADVDELARLYATGLKNPADAKRAKELEAKLPKSAHHEAFNRGSDAGAFKKLEGKLAHEKGVSDPAAVAASIGRKKYGATGMAKKAAAGRAKDEEIEPWMKRQLEARIRKYKRALTESSTPSYTAQVKKSLAEAEKDLAYVSKALVKDKEVQPV